MKQIFKKKFLTLLILLPILIMLAEDETPQGFYDPAGDPADKRVAFMSGNRFLLYFYNNTKLAQWPNWDYVKWPNDDNGVGMMDNGKPVIGAHVYLKNDSIPVDDVNTIANSDKLQELFYIQAGFSESAFGDKSQDGTMHYGLHPVTGYFNMNNEYIATSNREDSWPTQGWPISTTPQLDTKWPGEWNGRFGRGVKYAALESFYVANDAQDLEYLADTSIAEKYYPRRRYDSNGNIIEDIRIGDINPNITVQRGKPSGGIGISVKVRGYQWNNLQTRDAIFWEYDITNISFYNLTETIFGYRIDNGIGNLHSQSAKSGAIASFSNIEDMCYSWSLEGIGAYGLPTGVLGMAYLESPGVPDDNKDNDDDGIIDEKRDNQATTLVPAGYGIYDHDKFKAWYGKSVSDLGEHWDADEDGDWQDGIDANGNGIYDLGEFAGNDVGLDGVGPGDLNYTGPDEGECNHKPDFVEGIGCEPNFAATDISESDMIGLTSFHLEHHPHGKKPPALKFDEDTYKFYAKHELDIFMGEPSNLIEYFGSGPFILPKGATERISIAMLCSYEPLAGLNSKAHSAPSLFAKKKIAQLIYENDYRFAKAPLMPHLTAEPGDGKVTLTWDDVADKLTREPLINNINDFEGYKIYKATDKYFRDAELLTDMYGNPAGKRPIFQCDKKNGRKGAADYAVINGESFYLGNDTGIQHYFVDTDVQNGRTYYYAVVAYDYGISAKELSGYSSIDASVYPAENNVVVELNEDESIRQIGKNVAIVTPGTFAAGYNKQKPKILTGKTEGTGNFNIEILNTKNLKEKHQYKIKFDVETIVFHTTVTSERPKCEKKYAVTGFRIYDISDNNKLAYAESYKNTDRFANYEKDKKRKSNFSSTVEYKRLKQNNVISDAFDGIRVYFDSLCIEPKLDSSKTGWLKGDTPITIKVNADSEFITVPNPKTPSGFSTYMIEGLYYPWQYDIIFTTGESEYTSKFSKIFTPQFVQGGDGVYLEGHEFLGKQKFPFYVVNRTYNDTLDMVVFDTNDNSKFDLLEDEIIVGYYADKKFIHKWTSTIFTMKFDKLSSESDLPAAGDIYHIDFKRPFTERDSILFTIEPAITETPQKIDQDMKLIKVVPNPYIATNSMETAVSNSGLNQRRKIMFTHIPAKCTIKIFTASGIYIDEIKVNNEPADGKIYWDLLTYENLEIAAGVYIYHIKSEITGKEKIGKFAVMK